MELAALHLSHLLASLVHFVVHRLSGSMNLVNLFIVLFKFAGDICGLFLCLSDLCGKTSVLFRNLISSLIQSKEIMLGSFCMRQSFIVVTLLSFGTKFLGLCGFFYILQDILDLFHALLLKLLELLLSLLQLFLFITTRILDPPLQIPVELIHIFLIFRKHFLFLKFFENRDIRRSVISLLRISLSFLQTFILVFHS